MPGQAVFSRSRPDNTQVERLIEDALIRIATCDRKLFSAGQTTHASQREALAALYACHCWFEAHPELRDEYFKVKNIKVHGRAKYAAQPLIRFLVGSDERKSEIRKKVSAWSGALSWAERNKISPSEFVGFIQGTAGGIDGAYRLELEARRSKIDRQRRVIQLRQAKEAYQACHEPARLPRMPYTDRLEAGLHLLVVDVANDGSAHALGRLDRNTLKVEALFDEHVLTWFEANYGHDS